LKAISAIVYCLVYKCIIHIYTQVDGKKEGDSRYLEDVFVFAEKIPLTLHPLCYCATGFDFREEAYCSRPILIYPFHHNETAFTDHHFLFSQFVKKLMAKFNA
jgi:hypothetical protein